MNLPVFYRYEDLPFFYISELLEVDKTLFWFERFQAGISLLDIIVLKHFVVKELIGQTNLV